MGYRMSDRMSDRMDDTDEIGDSTDEPETLVLQRWNGPWAPDDPDANFKADVAGYRLARPLDTLAGMSRSLGVPVGALAHYVLARWATAGSEGLLQVGGSTVERMWWLCDEAEQAGTDAARLDAYERLRQIVGWLRVPLVDPEAYP
jgi:hypothetical protein